MVNTGDMSVNPGNTSYSIGFTYDGEHVDQLKPYAESFYKTIKMIQ